MSRPALPEQSPQLAVPEAAPTEETTHLIEIAQDYAAAGAAILPLHTPVPGGCSCRSRGCTNVGKHPRTMRGKDDATTDPETVTRWWSAWPAANVGIRPAPGLVILDVDPRHDGHVQLAAMVEKHGPLPATRTARTGSGGWHLWFILDGDVRGQLCPGVDVKTHTGYVVAPPSLHTSGERYAWTNAGAIAEPPDYLRGLLLRPARRPSTATGTVSTAVVAGLVRTVAEAPEGTRNARLYWAACRAAEKGIDVEPLAVAAEGNGLPREEVDRTIGSALTTVCGGAA